MVVGDTETTIRAVGGKTSAARVVVTPGAAELHAATSSGENAVMVDQVSARVVSRNSSGSETGLFVEPESTTLTGGSDTGSTRMRVDSDGVTFERVDGGSKGRSHDGPSGAPVPVHGVAAGKADTDAVNKGQLDDLEEEAFRGIAISNAMEVFMPDPDKNFRLNMGVGYYKNKTALGLTGSGRLTENIGLYLGAASDSSFEEVGGKAGVSFQW